MSQPCMVGHPLKLKPPCVLISWCRRFEVSKRDRAKEEKKKERINALLVPVVCEKIKLVLYQIFLSKPSLMFTCFYIKSFHPNSFADLTVSANSVFHITRFSTSTHHVKTKWRQMNKRKRCHVETYRKYNVTKDKTKA